MHTTLPQCHNRKPPFQHQVNKGTTYYNGEKPYQGQASGRQEGTRLNDGKKNFDQQRKRARDYPRQRGYQGAPAMVVPLYLRI